MSSEHNSKYSDQILTEAERCLALAELKIKSPGYLKHIIFEGLKGYGHGITAIPADSESLLRNYNQTKS